MKLFLYDSASGIDATDLEGFGGSVTGLTNGISIGTLVNATETEIINIKTN